MNKKAPTHSFYLIGFVTPSSSYPCRAVPVFSPKGSVTEGNMFFQVLDRTGKISKFTPISKQGQERVLKSSLDEAQYWEGKCGLFVIAKSETEFSFVTGRKEFERLLAEFLEAEDLSLSDGAPFFGLEASRHINNEKLEAKFAENVIMRLGPEDIGVAEKWLKNAPISPTASDAAYRTLNKLKRFKANIDLENEPLRPTFTMSDLIRPLPHSQKSIVFLAIDLTLIPLALLFSYTVQATLIQTLPILPYLILIAAGLSWWLGIPQIQLNAYERHAVGLTAIFSLLLAGSSAALAGLSGLPLPPGTHVMFGISYFLFSVSARVVLYQVVTAIDRRAQPRRQVLIYGAGTTGTQLASALRTHESIAPVAFVDDNTSLQGMMLAGLPVYPPSRLAELVKARSVKRVLLAMPSLSQPKQAQIARRLQKMGLEVQALPSFAQLIGEEALIDKLTPVAPQNFLGRAACDVTLGDACDSYAGRTVLVSGAGGSIGSELCRQVLSCRPKRLVLYELSELALYTVHQELTQLTEGTNIDIVPVLGSVADARQVRMVLNDHSVQVILHAAAFKHVPLVEANPLAGLSNNVFGTETLAREAAAAGVERFILISSDKAVRPTNVMGASKRLAELVVQDLATRHEDTVFTMVRFGNVLGSSGSVVPLFQEQISRGGPVTVTDPQVKRFFMTIREAVQLVLKAGAEARGGEVFVLDMGTPVAIMQLARQVIESAGYTVREDTHPDGDIEIEIIGLRPGEKIEEELTLSDDLIGTRYQKIFCAREEYLSEIEMAAILREFHHAVAQSDRTAAQDLIIRWGESWRPKKKLAKRNR